MRIQIYDANEEITKGLFILILHPQLNNDLILHHMQGYVDRET